MNTTFDGIILGAGHNALVLQAYLSRCGLKTLSLDRAESPGGGLVTLEHPRLSGFRYNPHSFFHRAITAMPWYRDLELHRHGVRYLEPKLNVAMILRDGRALEWWTDLERVDGTYSAYAGRDMKNYPLRTWPPSGNEPLIADDNDGGANHRTTTNVLYGDGNVRTFQLVELQEQGKVSPEENLLVVGPESPVEDLTKLTLD